MSEKLVSYAMDFASFFIQKLTNKQRSVVVRIILFGSVARSDADTFSDVDIFIDVVKTNKNLEKKINETVNQFRLSSKYTRYWEALGVENQINVTTGVLQEWEELHPSIIANGIVLYGKYKMPMNNGKHSCLFIWENINKESARVAVFRKLFGYTRYGTKYHGLLQEFGGVRLGKGCVIVPLEHSQLFHDLFKQYYITVKIKKVLEYT